MTNTKHFQNVKTVEELKKAYKELAKKFHPDLNKAKGIDTTETMKEINNEYDELVTKLPKSDTDNRTTGTSFDGFREILDAIIHLNVDVELCGSWVWVSGNTYAVKSELVEAGFKWAAKKKNWYWHPEGEGVKYKKNYSYSMDEIRRMHGSEQVKKASKLDEIAG